MWPNKHQVQMLKFILKKHFCCVLSHEFTLRGPGVRGEHWRDYILLNLFFIFHQPKKQSLGTEHKRREEGFSITRSSLQIYVAFFENYFLGLSKVYRDIDT